MASVAPGLGAALQDRYRLDRELGEGGMATVYLAEDLKHHRPVAIKVLRPELAQALGAERFLREIELTARLTHPHILPLLDSGNAAGFLYYVMPYVEGETLRDRLTREKQLPVDDALQLAREVADALSYAHQHGVIHRDIKPENILLEGRHAVVADFGIARAIDAAGGEKLTETGLAVGTPAYMSPEQGVGEPGLDGRTDIYALGCVLYEMLAGTPPFQGPTAQAIRARHATDPVPPLRTVRTTVPVWVEAAITKALAKVPADRWQSVDELLAHLDPKVTSEATGTVAVRRPRIRPTYLAAAALVLLSVGLATFSVLKHGQKERPAGEAAKRVAVLPFENLGPADQEYFADGITDEIISRLATIQGLTVISRTSAMQYKGTKKSLRQIGRELDVGFVLEGSVRWEKGQSGPGRIRVTPQLIRVSDDGHIWADRYDGVLADVFEVQSSIAEQMVRAMDVALLEPERRALAARPTLNLQAYDWYLRGNESYSSASFGDWEPDKLDSALNMYHQAVRADSGFALAWARIAQVELMRYFLYDLTPDSRSRGGTAAERSLVLAPYLPESHLAMGLYHYLGFRDYGAALQELAIALKARPSDAEVITWMGMIQRRSGQWKEALANLRRAVELAPRDKAALTFLAAISRYLRDFPQAERAFDQLLQLDPEDPDIWQMKAWQQLTFYGNVDKAKLVLREGESRVGLGVYTGWGVGQGGGGFAVALARDDEAMTKAFAMRSLDAYKGDTLSYRFARAYWLHFTGTPQAGRMAFDSLRLCLEAKLRAAADAGASSAAGRLHGQLGVAYAYLGRNAEAIREGRTAIALVPLSVDAYDAAENLALMAEIYTVVGEPDSAVALLRQLLSIPSEFNVPPLRIDPVWDPLRGNPRFQELLRTGS
jgi:serine/threonine-protein kinase